MQKSFNLEKNQLFNFKIMIVLYLKILIAGPFMGDIGSLHDAQTAAALDNKQNMEQREQYYATVRKPLRSPIHEMATLEKIPGEINRLAHIGEIKFVLFTKNHQ